MINVKQDVMNMKFTVSAENMLNVSAQSALCKF